jgi:hypothetical protein
MTPDYRLKNRSCRINHNFAFAARLWFIPKVVELILLNLARLCRVGAKAQHKQRSLHVVPQLYVTASGYTCGLRIRSKY